MKNFMTGLITILIPFCVLAQGHFVEHHIAQDFFGARGLDAADIDGDGDFDILVSAVDDHKLSWFENVELGVYTEHVIDENLANSPHVVAADLDGDGDIDAIATSSDDHAIYWYENSGSQNFSQHVLATSFNYANGLSVADVDSDGDLDVLSCAALGNQFAWFEQLPGGDFDQHIIGSGHEPRSIIAFDADGDGDQDVFGISAQDDMISWWENDGQQFWLLHIISTNYDAGYDLEPVDLDLDGDMDFVTCAVLGDAISWFENESGFFIQHSVSHAVDGPTSVIPLDYDNDGDIDIAAGSGPNGLVIFSDVGEQDFTLAQSFPLFSESRNMVAVDIDADGKKEVVASALSSHQVSWFDWQPGSVPYNFTVHLNIDGMVDLDWQLDDYTDFIEFRIYRNDQVIATSPQPEYQDQLPSSGEYTYKVSAYYSWGESDPSQPVSITWFGENAYIFFEDFENGLPESWIIQTITPTATWEWVTPGILPTYHMLINPGDARRVSERLIMPSIDGIGVTEATLQFDSDFQTGIDSPYRIQLSLDGGLTWETLRYQDLSEVTTVEVTISDEIRNQNQVLISFYLDLFDNSSVTHWAIDNVMVAAEREDMAIQLELFPQNDVVPADGGQLVYDAHLVSSLGGYAPGTSYWVRIRFNNGQEIGPIGTIQFTLPPFVDVTVYNMSVTVPASAPAGTHTLQGVIENRNLSIYRFTSEFEFEKLGDAQYDGFTFDPNEWPSNHDFGQLDESGLDASLPSEYEVCAAFPNPFNSLTTLSVALPEASILSVTVYNVSGQQVARLANADYSAGEHVLSFDASGMASGIYFIRTVVPNHLDRTQKIVLMK